MRRRTRRRAGWVVAAALAIAVGGCTDDLLADVQSRMNPAPTAAGPVTVVSITDGDTFRSSVGPVRIDNIEAPDSKRHPQRKAPECVDPAGAAAATAQLAALLPVGTVVELKRTGTSYGRVVALVSVGGVDVGQLMLASGTVDTYPATGGPCPWD